MTEVTLPAGSEILACRHVVDCGHFWRLTCGRWAVLCHACNQERAAGGVVVVPQIIELTEALLVPPRVLRSAPGCQGRRPNRCRSPQRVP